MLFLQQIRRDEAFRCLPLWMPTVALSFLFVIGLAEYQGGLIRPAYLVAFGWLFLALYLGFGPISRRASMFDLALPVHARWQWLAHQAAVAIGGTVIVGSLLLPLVLWSHYGGHPAADLPRTAAILAAGFVLATALLERTRPNQAEITARAAGSKAAVLIGSGLLLPIFTNLPATALLLPLAAALALGAWTWSGLPRGFVVVPHGHSERDQDTLPAAWPRPGETTGAERRAVLPAVARILVLDPRPWLAWALIAVFGVILSGLLTALVGDSSLRHVFVPFGIYVLISFAELGPLFLPRFDALPISRRRLFALITVPQLLAFSLGYGVGHALTSYLEPETAIVVVSENDGGGRWPSILVPVGFLEIAWDGDPPPLTAPWGETHDPWAQSLFGDSRAVIYSPWAVPRAATPAFFDHQLERAARDLFGLHVPADEIRRRLERRSGLSWGGPAEVLALPAPPDAPRHAQPFFPVLLASTVLPWLVFMALYYRLYRGTVSRLQRGVVLSSVLVVLFLSIFVQFYLARSDVLEIWVSRALLEIFVRELGESAAGLLLAWGGAALGVFLAYRLAERGFRRVEVPATVRGSTLWGSTLWETTLWDTTVRGR